MSSGIAVVDFAPVPTLNTEAVSRTPKSAHKRSELIALLRELLEDGRAHEADQVWTVLRQQDGPQASRLTRHSDGAYATLARDATTPAPLDRAPTGALDNWDF